jgi:hypothetical protein
MMIEAVCEVCGKKTGGRVPDDATGVTCFQCNEWRPYPSDLAEKLRFGAFEAHPAIFDDTEAWVLFPSPTEWRELPHSEVLQKTKVMSEAEFRRTYGDLPRLPGGAFA